MRYRVIGRWLLVLGAMLCDRLSKSIVLRMMPRTIVVCPGLLFDFSLNRGIALGIGAELGGYESLVWPVVAIIALLALFFGCQRLGSSGQGAFWLVVGGAVNNMVDRVLYGGVVDFIVVHAGSWFFPTFNIADVMIFIGVVGYWMSSGKE